MGIKNLTYKKSVLAELFFTNGISCAEISDKIGKSFSLTTKMINELVEEAVLEEGGLAPSSGGRRPLTYALKSDAFYVLAVSMDQYATRIALLDAHRNFIIPVVEKELKLANNAQSLALLTDILKDVIGDAPIAKSKILGIGIGMPGFIDPKKGCNYTFLGANICQYIKAQTGLPVFIENDSSTIALAEYKFGAAANAENAMVVNIGWGIGLGMIIDNKLFRGQEGFAGEFSHIPLFKNGKLCSCGKVGCLETETSLNYMLEKAKQEIENGKASFLKDAMAAVEKREYRWHQFVQGAIIGDTLAVEIVSNVAYNIGRGIAILIHLLNPGRIVLSGKGAAAGKIWLAPIQQALNEFCIPRLVSNTKVVISSLNYDAELIGAASLVLENIKSCPIEKLLYKQVENV